MFQALFEKLYKTLSHLIIFVKAKRLGFRSQLRKPFPCALQPALRGWGWGGEQPSGTAGHSRSRNWGSALTFPVPGWSCACWELCMLGAVLQPGRGDSNPDCAPAICVTSGK